MRSPSTMCILSLFNSAFTLSSTACLFRTSPITTFDTSADNWRRNSNYQKISVITGCLITYSKPLGTLTPMPRDAPVIKYVDMIIKGLTCL